MGRRVAIGNNKGGSGKTCAAVNLAAALAEQGRRVLVIDLDPQANASRRLGRPFDPAEPVPTTAEVIKSAEEGVAGDAITPCGWPSEYAERIHLIPARFDLENRVSEAGAVGAVARLRRALAGGVDDEYDVTLLDCPPSLGHLTQLGLAATRDDDSERPGWALCTVEPEYDSVEGAVRFRDFITAHRADLGNPQLQLLGYVVSRVRSNVGAHSYQLDGLGDTFSPEAIWSPYVPERAAFKDAADAAVPLKALGTPAGTAMAAVFAELGQRLVKEVLR
jgi:chromosome partitioning protein